MEKGDHSKVLGLNPEIWLFGVFGLVILAFLVIDLGLFQKKAHRITFQSALIQSIFWLITSMGFGGLVWYFDDHILAIQFVTAYLTEYSLSIDNIFVFILLFRHFKVKEEFHHRILYFGVFGAMIFRGIFIFFGNIIVSKFHWILYGFGAFLLYTGFKMILQKKEDEFDPEKSWVYRFLNKHFRFLHSDGGGKFFVRIDGKLHLTMLFLVVLLIETTDILFALDSIPAVFSISQNPFIIYTSNVFAIMGLRAMYFMLETIIDKFQYLKQGISFILMFIGGKMLMEIFDFHLPDWFSLVVIGSSIGGAILVSIFKPVEPAKPDN